jgi:hypothetical protein
MAGSRGRKASQDQLPQPPAGPRRIRVKPSNLVGLLLVLIAPALAVAGLVEPASGRATASSAELDVSVEHPRRMRYRTSEWVVIDVHNRTAHSLPGVTVHISPPYMQSFHPAIVIPAPTSAFAMDLGALGGGESRQLALQLQAEKYGRRRGSIRVEPRGHPAIEVPVNTFVLW